jgi:uncharacterized protein YggU (UPF0235/DUF167 family)
MVEADSVAPTCAHETVQGYGITDAIKILKVAIDEAHQRGKRHATEPLVKEVASRLGIPKLSAR